MARRPAAQHSGGVTETPPPGLHTDNLRDLGSLRRSTSDRMIAGVAGGLARHLNVDPVVVRVVFVVLAFFGGAGLALYGALWLLVPQDDEAEAPIHVGDGLRNALLIAAGVIAAIMVVGNSWGPWHFPWGIAIVALIVVAILGRRDSRRRATAATPPMPSPVPPAYSTTPTPPASPTAETPPQAGGTPGYTYSYGYTPPAYTPPTYSYVPYAPRPKRTGPILFGTVIALVAIGLGVLGMVDATASVDVPDAAYPALALAVIGAALMVGAFYGRPGGLVIAGLVAALALAGTAISHPRYHGDRDLTIRPSSASAVSSSYFVPAGRISFDLSQVSDPTQLEGRTVKLKVNAGEVVVTVPEGLTVEVDSDIEFAGATEVFGHTQGGLGISTHRTDGPGGDSLHLEIDMKFGHIEVVRA